MTTDEGAKNNGENPAAAVAERGEDITSKKDRGVLKVRPHGWMTYKKICCLERLFIKKYLFFLAGGGGE